MNTETFRQASRKDFNVSVDSVHSMMNKFIKINNKIFYVKRCNEYGDCALMKINEDGGFNVYENAANIFPVNKRSFKICFMYEGLSCEQKIKFSDVKTYYNE